MWPSYMMLLISVASGINGNTTRITTATSTVTSKLDSQGSNVGVSSTSNISSTTTTILQGNGQGPNNAQAFPVENIFIGAVVVIFVLLITIVVIERWTSSSTGIKRRQRRVSQERSGT